MQKMTVIFPCKLYWLLGCFRPSFYNRCSKFLAKIPKYSVPSNKVPDILRCPSGIRHVLPLCYLMLFLTALWKDLQLAAWQSEGGQMAEGLDFLYAFWIHLVCFVWRSTSLLGAAKPTGFTINKLNPKAWKYDSQHDNSTVPYLLNKKSWELLASLLNLNLKFSDCLHNPNSRS